MTLAIDGVGSHMPVLAAMVATTNYDGDAGGGYQDGGNILELGTGDFSTPFLHLITNLRRVWSFENDEAWYEKYSRFDSEWHDVTRVNWDQAISWASRSDKQWAVVLVDHAPGDRRVKDIEELRPVTDFFVVHDAEDSPAANYGFAKCFASFKYVWKWGACNVDTAVLSDRYPIPLEGL